VKVPGSGSGSPRPIVYRKRKEPLLGIKVAGLTLALQMAKSSINFF